MVPPAAVEPAPLALTSSTFSRATREFQLRPSSEGLLKLRAAGAQELPGCPAYSLLIVHPPGAREPSQ